MFREYFGKPEATRDAFTADGWFNTGDVAILDDGAYRILGRESVDILKTGGYKVSALDIEEALREHPAIASARSSACRTKPGASASRRSWCCTTDATLDARGLRAWCKQRLAPYKVPALLRCVRELPRNAMGKVVKPEVVRLVGA